MRARHSLRKNSKTSMVLRTRFASGTSVTCVMAANSRVVIFSPRHLKGVAMETQTTLNRFIFMKVGNHAGEDWDQILARKKKEFEQTGFIFWGYGGSACHPINQVQPFARLAVKEDDGVKLVMQPIRSNANQTEV